VKEEEREKKGLCHRDAKCERKRRVCIPMALEIKIPNKREEKGKNEGKERGIVLNRKY